MFDALPLIVKVIVVLLGGLAGLVFVSLITAICLRIAAAWLRFAEIPFGAAFRSTLASNFVIIVLNVLIGMNHRSIVSWLSPQQPNNRNLSLNLIHIYSPIYLLYGTLFGLLVTACIFSRTISRNDQAPRHTFSDWFALSSMSFALFTAVSTLLVWTAISLVSLVTLSQ